MNFIIILLVGLIGAQLAKIFNLYIISQDPKSNKFIGKISFSNYLIFSDFFKSTFKSNKFLQLSILSQILGFSVFTIAFLGFLNDESNFQNISFLIYSLLIISFLLYIAIYDLLYFHVPVKPIVQALFVLVLFNLFFALTRLIINLWQNANFTFEELSIGGVNNIFGIVVAYFATLALVKFSNEKAMGEGDADINALIGLVLGASSLFSFFFYTVTIGASIGLVYSYYKKQFHGLLIPFVPIILIGFTMAMYFNDELINFFGLNSLLLLF